MPRVPIAILLLAALLLPGGLSAKGVIPRVEEESYDLEDDYGPGWEVAPEEVSVEVTEVVTQEVLELERPARVVHVDRCALLLDDFGLKRKNLFRSEWGGFLRLAGYNPVDNAPASGSLLANLGLRYKVPDKNGAYHALAYELGYSYWSGSTATMAILELAIKVFACSSPVLTREHHPYYGISFGNAEVEPQSAGTFNENVFGVFGGVEFPGRKVDWDVYAKYIYGPDSRYNLDDLQVGVGMTYRFAHGK